MVLRIYILFYSVLIFHVTNGEPFFGLEVTGGFNTEKDISSAALGVVAPFLSMNASMTKFNAQAPFSTVLLSDAAEGVSFIYNGVLTTIQNATELVGKAAIDVTSDPIELFAAITEALTTADEFVKATPAEVDKIKAVSTEISSTLTDAFGILGSVVGDLSDTMSTFESSLSSLGDDTHVTSAVVFKVLNKFKLAKAIGILDAFKSQIEIVQGQVADVVLQISTSNDLMSSFTSLLTDTFSTLDAPLSSKYNAIMKSSDSFANEITSTLTKLNTATVKFNDKIKTFSDDIIGANFANISAATNEFVSFYKYFLDTLLPNSQEKFEAVASWTTDSIQTAARDVLFNTYQMLDNAIRNLPSGSTCAKKYLTPLVKTLSTQIPSLSSCLNSLDSNAVAQDQLVTLKNLLEDRLYYTGLWADAIKGVTSKSSASVRRIALNKLLAKTPSSNVDVYQPALASTYSIFAQLVSNFNHQQNRVTMCLTLKGVDYSALVISASNAFFSCIKRV
uniref:Putative conserved secreted protein n=1 Tax=Culex tarsalis TaxID=7177 RepID=A0A1Q3FAU2_CULTA